MCARFGPAEVGPGLQIIKLEVLGGTMKSLKIVLVLNALFALSACASGGGDSNSSASTQSVFSVYPTVGSVVANSSFSFYPTGGTSPYTFSVYSGGGSLSQTSGTYSIYYAPSSAGTSIIRVVDAAGNVIYYTITISTSSTTTTTTTTTSSSSSCEGAYSVSLNGTSGTMYLVQDSTGYLGGYMYLSGYYYFMSGTCSLSSSTGSISLYNWQFGSQYSGTITVSGSSASISGSMTSNSTSYSWSASRSSLFGASTITQSCEGTYSATIGSNTGTIYLFGDSGGNVIGELYMLGYHYVLAGTCIVNGTTGTISMTNLTVNSSYTGTVTVGSSISMSGTFTTSAGSSYSWSGVSQ